MLAALWAEYEDRKTQWGGDYLWTKHEDADAIAEVKAFIAGTDASEKTLKTAPTAPMPARKRYENRTNSNAGSGCPATPCSSLRVASLRV
jgi:hypothetical protein